jgi:hypothetical protein
MLILRRRHSDKQVGDLHCQNTLVVRGIKVPCGSKRLRFVGSEGPVDTYKCKDCGCLLRYHTIPMDSRTDAAQLQREGSGIHPKELNRIAGLTGKMNNLGNFKVRQHKLS